MALVDLPPSHPAFKDVSRAVAAGVLDAPNRTFDPTRLVTGAEAQDARERGWSAWPAPPPAPRRSGKTWPF